jgi:DHA2 family methylenomycin A resistance protein-like MFS transporter
MVTGILLACISLPMTVLSPITGRISDSLGRRPLVTAGSVLLVGATALLLIGISEDVGVTYVGFALAGLGIGMSLSFGAASVAAIESTPREMAGTAAGTNSMMRYLGSIIGAGVLGAVLNTEADAPEIAVFRLIFAVLFVMSLLAFGCSFFIHRFPTARSQPAAREPSTGAARVGVPGS